MGWLEDVKSKGLQVDLRCPDDHLDLNEATIVTIGFSERLQLYGQVLSKEIEKRSTVTIPVVTRHEFLKMHGSSSCTPTVIALQWDASLTELEAEGYQLRVDATARRVDIIGPTERSVLFGVGRLLREARLDFHRLPSRVEPQTMHSVVCLDRPSLCFFSPSAESYSSPLRTLCCIDISLRVASRPADTRLQQPPASRHGGRNGRQEARGLGTPLNRVAPRGLCACELERAQMSIDALGQCQRPGQLVGPGG